MNHEQAIDIHAAEGYLLGDLSTAERDAFEEHYFDCDTCFADVRDGATVVAGARAAARDVKRGYASFFPAFAAAASVAVAVLGTAVYQQLAVIGPLRAQVSKNGAALAKERQAHVLPVKAIGDARAELKVIENGRAPFVLEFTIFSSNPSSQYNYKVADAHGKTWLGGPVSAEQTKQPVDLYVPGGVLPPGDYSLIVTGTGGESVLQAEFTVR